MIDIDQLYTYIMGDFDSVDEVAQADDIERFLAENFEYCFDVQLETDETVDEMVRGGVVTDSLCTMSEMDKIDVYDRAVSVLRREPRLFE